jgi:hypothetical protein
MIHARRGIRRNYEVETELRLNLCEFRNGGRCPC